MTLRHEPTWRSAARHRRHGTGRESALTGRDDERVALIPGHAAGASHRPKRVTQGGDVLPDEVVKGPQLLLDVGCLTSRARTFEQAIEEQGREVRGVAGEERIRGCGKLRWQAAEGLEPCPAF